GLDAEPAQLRERGRVERPRADAACAELLQPAPHLACCLVREGDREDLVGGERADRNLVRDPPRDRRRLARAGARKDADGTTHRLDRTPLLGVQPVEDRGRVHRATLAPVRDGAVTIKRRDSAESPPAASLLGRRTLACPLVGDETHQLLSTAEAVYRRTKAREQVHQRLQ